MNKSLVLFDALDASEIRTAEAEILKSKSIDVIDKESHRRQWIQRNFVEAFDGVCVKVQRNNAISAHKLNDVSNHTGRNRSPLAISPFLPAMRKVWDNQHYLPCRRPPCRINRHQHLKEVLVRHVDL